jgi:hypothetical protein
MKDRLWLEISDSLRPYTDDALRRWKAGDYDAVLKNPRISPFIRDILREKARRRFEGAASRQKGDRRFFGEAFVAGQIPHDHGWYGSFKWLTSTACEKALHTADRYSREFGAALRDHFGGPLSELRDRARRLFDLPKCRRPMPPDLWLIISGGTHRFIETKLRGDGAREPQLRVWQSSPFAYPASFRSPSKWSGSTANLKRAVAEREDAEKQEIRGLFRDYCRRVGCR